MTQIVVTPDAEIRAVNEPGPQAVQLADCTPEEQLEKRYLDAVNALLDDAFARRAVGTMADVLAWSLARIAMVHDTPAVAGDIVRLLGSHMCSLAERRRAAEEADRAKQEGHKPH